MRVTSWIHYFKTLKLSFGQKEASVKQSTVLEKLKELDTQRDELLSDAKKDALTRAEEAVSELNTLGFHYYLGEGEAGPTLVRRSK
jgi:hypothetical protein